MRQTYTKPPLDLLETHVTWKIYLSVSVSASVCIRVLRRWMRIFHSQSYLQQQKTTTAAKAAATAKKTMTFCVHACV